MLIDKTNQVLNLIHRLMTITQIMNKLLGRTQCKAMLMINEKFIDMYFLIISAILLIYISNNA